WTSIGDRKMLTCCHDPGGVESATAGPATSTRPSAGDSTASSSDGETRLGSRKKNRKKPARRKNGAATSHAPAMPHARATASAPPMNGQAAGSMRTDIDPYLNF